VAMGHLLGLAGSGHVHRCVHLVSKAVWAVVNLYGWQWRFYISGHVTCDLIGMRKFFCGSSTGPSFFPNITRPSSLHDGGVLGMMLLSIRYAYVIS
jgi:hypothetical protein